MQIKLLGALMLILFVFLLQLAPKTASKFMAEPFGIEATAFSKSGAWELITSFFQPIKHPLT